MAEKINISYSLGRITFDHEFLGTSIIQERSPSPLSSFALVHDLPPPVLVILPALSFAIHSWLNFSARQPDLLLLPEFTATECLAQYHDLNYAAYAEQGDLLMGRDEYAMRFLARSRGGW
jgi:hypothetical protein